MEEEYEHKMEEYDITKPIKDKDPNSVPEIEKAEPSIKKRKGFKRLWFNIKYGIIYKKMSPEEFLLAGEYLDSKLDIYTMEKDLLLRGMIHKNVLRIIDCYEYLRWLSNIPEIKLLTETQLLKGGILDGIRRSQQNS